MASDVSACEGNQTDRSLSQTGRGMWDGKK